MSHLTKSIFLLLLFLITQNFGAYVAILETIANKVDISRSEKQYLTDVLRQKAVKTLPASQGYTIMTRENIISMLPPGKSIEECEGECLTETGKNISADYIAQGRLGTFGSKITLTVEMYETAGNKLVSSFTTRKSSIEEIVEEIEQKSDSLFLSIKPDNFIVQPNLPGITTGHEEKRPEPQSLKTEFTDSRNGMKYTFNVVKNKAIMTSNLNYPVKDSYCYDDKKSNCNKFGRLYTWKAALKACPKDWYLPSIKELEKAIPGTWDDIFLPGQRTYSGVYEDLQKNVFFWSRSIHEDKSDYAYYLSNQNGFWGKKSFYKDQGFSVRCIRSLTKEEQAVLNSPPKSEQILAGYMKDNRDNKIYKVKVIGDKTYMAENLSYYMPNSFCYDDDVSKCKKTGRLYTWNSAIRACPKGWRLPSIDEIIEDFVDFPMKKIQKGGFRTYGGSYTGFGKKSLYWSGDTKENYSDYAYYGLFDDSDWEQKAFYKDQANSVRCVKED